MPFSDPMADGPAIQAAGLRALGGGMTLRKTLDLGAPLPQDGRRHADHPDGLLQPDLPLRRGALRRDAARDAGVDGLIIVDLPPEEDAELRPFAAQGRPVDDPPDDADDRRPAPAGRAQGRDAASSTTSRSPASPARSPRAASDVAAAVARIRQHTEPAGRGRLRHQDARAGRRDRAQSPTPPWSARRWSRRSTKAGQAGALDFVRALGIAVRGARLAAASQA